MTKRTTATSQHLVQLPAPGSTSLAEGFDETFTGAWLRPKRRGLQRSLCGVCLWRSSSSRSGRFSNLVFVVFLVLCNGVFFPPCGKSVPRQIGERHSGDATAAFNHRSRPQRHTSSLLLFFLPPRGLSSPGFLSSRAPSKGWLYRPWRCPLRFTHLGQQMV
jgi:hypothetical protein